MDYYTLSKIMMVIALAEPLILYLACWPSTRNLIATHYLPVSLLPLVGGVLFFFDFRIGLLGGDAPYLGSLLVVLTVGATAHAIAVYIGFRFDTPLKAAVSRLMDKLEGSGTQATNRLVRTVTVLAIVSAALQLFSYAKMGFAPIFADNPFDAKYYSGEYAENYAPVAPFLRMGFQIFAAIAPLFMICFPKSFGMRVWYSGVILIAAGTVFLSLKRGPIAIPFIDFALAWSVFYRKGKYASVAMLLYVGVFAFGAAANGMLAYALGLTDKFNIEAVFGGVPDVSDLLQFWSGFQTRHYELSFGRTILGALIPYRYDWNMSVVTKLAVGASRDAPTGGLRLPDAVYGYVAFGYIGAILWPAFTGAIAGIQLSLLKRLVERRGLTFYQFYIMYFAQTAVMGFMASLLSLSLDVIVAIFFTYAIMIIIIGRSGARTHRVQSSI